MISMCEITLKADRRGASSDPVCRRKAAGRPARRARHLVGAAPVRQGKWIDLLWRHFPPGCQVASFTPRPGGHRDRNASCRGRLARPAAAVALSSHPAQAMVQQVGRGSVNPVKPGNEYVRRSGLASRTPMRSQQSSHLLYRARPGLPNHLCSPHRPHRCWQALVLVAGRRASGRAAPPGAPKARQPAPGQQGPAELASCSRPATR